MYYGYVQIQREYKRQWYTSYPISRLDFGSLTHSCFFSVRHTFLYSGFQIIFLRHRSWLVYSHPSLSFPRNFSPGIPILTQSGTWFRMQHTKDNNNNKQLFIALASFASALELDIPRFVSNRPLCAPSKQLLFLPSKLVCWPRPYDFPPAKTGPAIETKRCLQWKYKMFFGCGRRWMKWYEKKWLL